MADRPIIFSAPMIRALLDGRKSQTRRVLKPPYGTLEYLPDGTWRPICTKFFRGDRLWVRETWADIAADPSCDLHATGIKTAYRATDDDEFTIPPRWRPSIHMPRWASRMTLIVTDVRVQRLQDISEADAEAEGWKAPPPGVIGWSPVGWFADLWGQIHGPDAWAANPWVCALTFTVHRCNIEGM